MKKVITASNYEVIPLDLRTNVRFYTSVDFGSYVPPHWHDAIEILYLQEGELKVNTESTSRNLRSGQCTLIQPNKVHSTLCTRPNKAIVFQIPLLFLEKFVPDASRLTFQLEGTLRQASQPEWDRQKTQINQFKEKLTQMQFIMDTKPDGAPLMFNTLLFDVLYQLYHNFSFGFTADSTSRQNQNLEKLKPVLDYINCNYNRAISLTEISRIAMFDPKYFCRFFKKWTEDGWLRMENGGNMAQEFVEESKLSEYPVKKLPQRDEFDSETLGIGYYAPRIDPVTFVDLKARPGWLRLRGQESGCSLNKTSILARKLTSVQATVTTKVDFTPLSYQHTAGLILYYDNMNFVYLYKYFSDTLNHSAISVMQVENGIKREFSEARTFVEDGRDIWMRLEIKGRKSCFKWSLDGDTYKEIGPCFDTTKFSDEYSEFGEFTGTFVGITCGDRMLHQHTADFDFFEYVADETADVK